MKLSNRLVICFSALGFMTAGFALSAHVTRAFGQEASTRADEVIAREFKDTQSREFRDVLGISCVNPLAAVRIVGLRQTGEHVAAAELMALSKAGKPWCRDYNGLINVKVGELETGRAVGAICNPLSDPHPCVFRPIQMDLSGLDETLLQFPR